MNCICANCLNAYNSPYHKLPQCYNKDWLYQGQDADCSVRPDESCGTWQRRGENQPPVKFPRAVQLELFKE